MLLLNQGNKQCPSELIFMCNFFSACRYHGRKCLSLLYTQPDFDKYYNKFLSDKLKSRMKEAIEFIKNKVLISF